MSPRELSVIFSLNLVQDVQQLFAFPFMVHAFQAGTIVAILAAAIGWFMVLRRQSFAGHTLAVVGFPGAAGATLIGLSASWGYFAFCIGAALVLAGLTRSTTKGLGEDSAVTGTVQAFLLATGFLFATLYKGFLDGIYSYLFGSFLGITSSQVTTLLIVAVVALAVLAMLGRPLFFASIDADVAAARGVPVRLLGTAFLVLLGIGAAETSQITGTLLVFALLVMPAATAQLITKRPGYGVGLSIVLSLVVTWLGLGVAYYSPYPIGFFVTTFAFGFYLAAQLARRLNDRQSIRQKPRVMR